MNINSVEKKFVYIAIIFGLIIMVLTPPFQSPDEDSHFKKAYVLSKGNIFPEEQGGEAGFELPVEMVQYIETEKNKAGDFDQKAEFKDVYMKERLPAGYTESKFYNFSTARTNPLGHCIQAFGIICGQVIAHILGVKDPSVVYQLYFAHFFNLLFYVTIIAASIKLTPILKRTFTMIALMPMSLFQATTTSYDPILIALAFLATAVIFNIIFNEKVKEVDWKYFLLLGIIAYIFIAIKIVYLPLLFLMIAIPKEKWGNKKNLLKKLIVLVGTIVTLLLLFKIITPSLNLTQSNNNILAHKQMLYVVKRPWKYCIIFLNTLIRERHYLISTTIGTFGLIDTNLYCLFLGIYIFALPIVGISEMSLDNKRIRVVDRLAVFISVAAPIFGCFLAMYIYWTSVMEEYGIGASEITGVQGRYFIPVMPTIFMLFSNQILCRNNKIRKGMWNIVDNSYLIITGMLCVSVVAILLRFWC